VSYARLLAGNGVSSLAGYADHADLFVGIRHARARVVKVDGDAPPLQFSHCFFGAFLGRGEVGRASEFGDHEDHVLSSSKLGLQSLLSAERRCLVGDGYDADDRWWRK
jgi:hypothetical protein